MSVDSVFEDIVMTCEFYSEVDCPLHVDFENLHVSIGDYGVEPVMENGLLVGYLVEDPEGVTQLVEDLDHYFQRVFKWKEYV